MKAKQRKKPMKQKNCYPKAQQRHSWAQTNLRNPEIARRESKN